MTDRQTDRQPWFSRLLRHPARKRIGSILTTSEPARGLLQYRTSTKVLHGFHGPHLSPNCSLTLHPHPHTIPAKGKISTFDKYDLHSTTH